MAPTDESDLKLCKTLAYLLRHGAITHGLNIDSGGYVNIKDILEYKSLEEAAYTPSDVVRVVQNDDKRRFRVKWSDGDVYVKAEWGHTFDQSTKHRDDIKLGKTLLYFLRHRAIQHGLHIDSEGYVDVNEILQLPVIKRGKYTMTDIDRVVNQDPFQRYHLKHSNNLVYLRANPSLHPVDGYLDSEQSIRIFEASELPLVLHATYFKNFDTIKTRGLTPKPGKYIYLASRLPDEEAVTQGLHRTYELYIYIDVEKALSAGIAFYKSENGVILTPGDSEGFLSNKYFSKMVEIRTGKTLKC